MAVAVRMAGDRVHPFFMTKFQALLNTETDLDARSRKRRKTSEPDQVYPGPDNPEFATWADQLQDAARGSNADLIDGTDTASTIDELQQTGDTASIGNDVRKECRQSYADLFVSPSVDETDSLIIRAVSGAPMNSNEGKGSTPPKKMLKVRADGKLGSPRSRPPKDKKAKGRKEKVRGDKGATDSLFVCVHYGKNVESRNVLGRKIDVIMFCKQASPYSNQETVSKDTKTTELAKPTHPFFLEGGVRSQGQHQGIVSEGATKSERNPETEASNSIASPRTSRIISKPPRRLDISLESGPVFPTFGSDHGKMTRFPGAQDPIFPPMGMVHVGRGQGFNMPSSNTQGSVNPMAYLRKLKQVQIDVSAEEDILHPYLKVVRKHRQKYAEATKMLRPKYDHVRRPRRHVMTGLELQQAVRARISSHLPGENGDKQDELNTPQPPTHCAILDMYSKIVNSRSAFDTFGCESQDWAHKYAPKAAEKVLQQSRDVAFLRDWLRRSMVSSVENGSSNLSHRESSVTSRRTNAKVKKRKRRKVEGLDDFVISTDEEGDQMDSITDTETKPGEASTNNPSKSIIRAGENSGPFAAGERTSNAIVISGPHGCGKTASVFAVAEELDFEIFEINSSSRRSGKDILEKVGSMTRNHLVRHKEDINRSNTSDQSVNTMRVGEGLEGDTIAGRQGMMKSFFDCNSESKKKLSPTKKKALSSKKIIEEHLKKTKLHKQSLILFEEADILFEEDRMFWATTLDLIMKSKRPVIITCTDESRLPLDEMMLHAIFRLTPPSEHLAVDYLLLIACNEGHLLSRSAVLALYRCRNLDLRASLAELQFFCQMAVGDRKGGLEWMLLDFSSREKPLRVVSEDTYCKAMGWLGGQDWTHGVELSLEEEVEMFLLILNEWNVDVGYLECFSPGDTETPEIPFSPADTIEALQRFDRMCEGLSAADIFPGGLVREEDKVLVDATQPDYTEMIRSNYTEDSRLLQVDPISDHTGEVASLALALRASAKQLVQHQPITAPQISEVVLDYQQAHRNRKIVDQALFSAAFDPIAKPMKQVLGVPKISHISSFESPKSIIATDLAPYIRSIVSYDVRLEEQRRQLDNILSKSGYEGRKARTTRASRAALEGGDKANTRRERWFPPNTQFGLVMQSGGKGWQDVALKYAQDDDIMEHDSSRRSSIASVRATKDELGEE